MEPLLLYPDPAPPELVQALELAGYPVEGHLVPGGSGARRARRRLGRRDHRGGRTTRRAPSRCAARCASATSRSNRCSCWSPRQHLDGLELREDLFDDFCMWPFQPRELEARLKHLFWRTGRGTRPELVEYGPLVLNTETYQAAVNGRPLDLTFLEYELLKFLATHPGKVFTRQTLLSRVWGYEYYGGARTVDVHVRRLRAKLDDEANLIQTVRRSATASASPAGAKAPVLVVRSRGFLRLSVTRMDQ